MKRKIIIHLFWPLAMTYLILGIWSCESFVEIEPPNTSLTSNVVFTEESTTTAALLNIYTNMSLYDTFPFSGEFSLSWMSGLMADEFESFFNDNRAEFAENKITPENRIVQQNWNALYEIIYTANILIEQMELPGNNLSQSFKDKIEGEARFLRGLMYYYLVNFWENVPLVLTTDYLQNKSMAQSTKEAVYVQIVEDLQKAEVLLEDKYGDNGRTRPSRYTAKALLAKIYSHTQQWDRVIEQTTSIINSGLYQMESDPDEVFLTSSNEVIWRLEAVYPNVYTWEAYRFVLIAVPTRVTVSNTLLAAFDDPDKRRVSWIGTYAANNGNIYYFPNKYKVRRIPNHPGAPAEAFVMFRLGEQYLIRAEARVHTGDLAGANQDLNMTRIRAGLPSMHVSDPSSLLEEILLERRLELFTEGFNRWSDMKRTGGASTRILPIPQNELIYNPSLVQNPGY
jgi:hypothetical protein